MMMKKSILIPYVMILLLPEAILADPRDQVATPPFLFKTFSQTWKTYGPDTDYGLGQCYGDLSLIDCVLCHAGARTVVARCYPANGATVYLDGCFMRSENYSFFHEYYGPNDQAVIRALSRAVSAAPNSNGYARAQVAIGNDSAYVLANCWRTISGGMEAFPGKKSGGDIRAEPNST
ncbi:hypothetical protein ACS0TY_009044 [Phlomoides rotata]